MFKGSVACFAEVFSQDKGVEDQQTPNSNRDRRLDVSKLYKYTICNMQTTLRSTI
jgi:hypothetical protein